jgi:UDP-N-acetylmuramoyl-tripeptide--D-alanyl-D-alanine ligase
MLKLKDILDATVGTLLSGGTDQFKGLSIDSRTIKDGELFIPIEGERFDGHDFVEASLKTCAGAIVSRQWMGRINSGDGKTIIQVEDTLQALQDIARFIRKGFRGPVVAIVGSNGKTTTKELISLILGTRFKVLKTEGNLNNHIGMPLCMTRADEDTGAMVLEMGTNRPGDVDLLCRIASPDIGVVTNIGFEHLQGFGSLESVRDAELEILPYLEKVVLNGDDDLLIGSVSLKFKGPIVTFGIGNEENDVTASDIEVAGEGSRFVLHASGLAIAVESKLSGRFNIYNSLAACAAAHTLGIGLDKIKEGLEAFGGVRMRFEIRKVRGVTYLYDVYNANPSSMKASIEELARMAGITAGHETACMTRAIAVLGDMLELGDYGVRAHREVGEMLSGLGVAHLIAVGQLMNEAVSGFGRNAIAMDSSEEAGAELASLVRDGDVVLIKGSRGMKMEKVMDVIEKGVDKNAVAEGRE